MLKPPAIVILAHQRTHCFKRLLKSLFNASYPNSDVNLIISIDKSSKDELIKIAQDFIWTHGEKHIIEHPLQLGLLNHMLFVFSLTEKYENIIVLEDDLWVSPFFYSFTQKALDYYQSDDRVTGISLYSYHISESSLLAFTPVDDGSAVYFMCYPSSWGLCISKDKIKNFLNAYHNNQLNNSTFEPPFVKNWPQQSWKRYMIRFLLETNTYFVFPRLSLSTNFSPKGTNTPLDSELFQVNIQNLDRNYNFKQFSQSKAIYDSYFEMTAACLNTYIDDFKNYQYTVDLQGMKGKDDILTPYVLTVKKTQNPLFRYASSMKPVILNVIHHIEGNSISFDTKENVLSKSGKIHYGHTEFLHKYSTQMLYNRISFLKYIYFYLKFELKMYWQKIRG